MSIVPVMWSVWGVIVALLAALYVYRSSLTRDEEDQIFLGEAFAHEETAQAAIVSRVNKVQPIVRILTWLAAGATVFVLGYYVLDILAQFK